MQNAIAISELAGGRRISPQAFHAMTFNAGVAIGFYKKEKVRCFCGSKERLKLTDKDRYGIDYTLCLCKECGILYSSPRLTEESFKMFYERDYRNIYSDMGEVGSGDKNIKKLIDKTIEDYELSEPKVVFDIGCGTGEILQQFDKYECVGIDYDSEAIAKGKEKGLNLHTGGIDVLEGLGKKADLIIMNHVLEHMTDIESDLKRIRDLLSDKGILYVAVPGLYVWDTTSLLQNAHNYQFNSNTLYYLMHVCGFDDYHINEAIQSIWYKSDFIDKKNMFKDEWKYIESFLVKKDNKHLMPSIRMNCKFSLKEMRKNMEYTVKSGMPEIGELVNTQPDSEAVIICGGPSVNGYVGKIKELQAKGANIYSIERMYQWCLKNDITPDYVVALDASDDVIESFVKLNEDVTHIVVSHVKKEIIDILKDKKAYYFNLNHKGFDYGKLYKNREIKTVTFVHAGASVSLCCLNIAMTVGAKSIHMFGFDCHVTDQNYADGITGVGDVQDILEIEIEDRVFKTTSQYYAFMQQFFQMYQTGKDCDMLKDIKIYGDSMAKAAAKIDINGDKERKVI